EIHEKTGIPVVVVMGKEPNMEEFRSALKNLNGFEQRIAIVERAGEIYRYGNLFLQFSGLNFEDAKKIVDANVWRGKFPEALRIAHLVASAVVHGESKNR
ncbi:MAG: DUF99 family protein, partial [Archaeoglobaceae archaeon]